MQGGQGSEPLTRDEARALLEETMQTAAQEGGRGGKLREGLDEATETALKNAADNVGGVFGTIQRILDESMVEYARRNPEWVIENIDIITKFMGTAEDASAQGPPQPAPQSEQDARVDSAMQDLEEEPRTPQQTQGREHQGSQQQFEPSEETLDAMGEGSERQEPPPSETEPSPMSAAPEDAASEPESTTTDGGGLDAFATSGGDESAEDSARSEESTGEQTEEGNENSGQDSFDEIFGDIAEE